ncbi:hypothetical protein L596_030627 [Steinernema carpocapsae]|uniref:Alpha-mannosidase n=1 Tax=Steinernema carpocapsae TaxID=34508 RepID=A0A4U5LQ04_STECR|nr:hypothetical protein L596_030627 [Steinernema carpocapsae]
MRCLKTATIGLIFAFAAIYSVAVLFVGDHSFYSFSTSLPLRGRQEPSLRVFVEPDDNADVQIDGSRFKLAPNLSVRNGQNEKLDVFVVLHSHVDPGWLETFDDYYAHKVDSILHLAVSQLAEHADLRFIWSEVSFLERWWQTANETQRKRAKKLVAEGRFEICGGSWVMTDEATPYFWASIDDLVEGQRFLTEIFNVTPTTSWSVDPFGHGTMIPFMLPLTGIENLVIGRINNELKGMIRQQSLLNLNWKQGWKSVQENGHTRSPPSAFINILPNKYYTTSDACGPDLYVCCQFDIGPSARSFCGKRANDVSPQNVELFANQLADQYRKLSKFYRYPSILVPVGDDFFFSVLEDWIVIRQNYRQILDFINTNPKYNMTVRFATPREFFASIPKEGKASAPSLSGDFFPYMDDRRGPFPAWTGFYAHLPYHKRMGRIVEAKLRSLDLLRIAAASDSTGLEKSLIDSRRNLALFQHHDGITGTSKKHVMADFLQRLFYAYGNITDAQVDMVQGDQKEKIYEPVDVLEEDGYRFLTKKLFRRVENPSSEILIFNPLTIQTTRQIVVRVDSPKIRVISGDDSRKIPAQILPEIVNGTISDSVFQLIFFTDLKPLAKAQVLLEFTESQPSFTVVSKVFSSLGKQNIFPAIKPEKNFTMENGFLRVNLQRGKIQSLTLPNEKPISFRFDLAKYADSGGAYVFLPGAREELPSLKEYFYISGPLCNRVVARAESVNISHSITVFSSKNPILDSSLDIEVISNVRNTMGETFIFVLGSRAIRNNGTFYTDANGLHMMRRHFNGKESLAMNFYPSPSDPKHRLSLLLAQPTAASSLSEGHFEIMVDRQLQGDDGKGLSYGDADTSPPSKLNYRILIERRKNKPLEKSLFHSALGFYTLQDLLYPVVAMTRPASSGTPLVKWPLFLTEPLPCDTAQAPWNPSGTFSSPPTRAPRSTFPTSRVARKALFSTTGLLPPFSAMPL